METLTKGDKGLSVGMVQQSLIEAGYSIPQDETSSFLFGDVTYQDVCAFQSSHLGTGGRPLVVDGVVGPETWYALRHPGSGQYIATGWRFEPSNVNSPVRNVLVAAVNEIGVHEEPDGSNDGPRVRTYTAPDYIGSPWCACFASWAFSHADGGSPFGRIAAVWGLFNWAKEQGHVVATEDQIQPGDIFLILRGSASNQNHRGHCGIICYVEGISDSFSYVAGNESNSVRGGIRNRKNMSAIIRPVNQ